MQSKKEIKKVDRERITWVNKVTTGGIVFKDQQAWRMY